PATPKGKTNPKDISRLVCPRTVNRQVGVLCNMLNMAVKWKRIGWNPIADLAPLKHVRIVKQRRSLTVSEVSAIFAKSPPRLLPVWRAFMCTGLRKNELVNMKFADVDFERRTVTIHAETAKNGREREIPLDDHTLSTIKK